MIEIDLQAIRHDHELYTALWREAQQNPRKELFAILAATRCADRVPALLDAIQSLLLLAQDESDTPEGRT